MQDPIEKVKVALRSAGAKYRGGGSSKGSEWVFPDGQVFLFERKAGNPTIDARVATRKLNQMLTSRNGVQAAPSGVGVEAHAPAPTAPPPVVVPAYEPLQPLNTPASISMNERWTAAVAQAEAYQEKLLADAQMAERRVQMLKAMMPFMDDPMFADTLRAVLPSPEPLAVAAPPPSAPPPPEPPQHITERVQVTRQLVFAATQTFECTFTINDLVARMANGANIDGPERVRVRSSVASAMMTLLDRGEVIRAAEGYGRRQAIWRRADIHRPNGDGVEHDAQACGEVAADGNGKVTEARL